MKNESKLINHTSTTGLYILNFIHESYMNWNGWGNYHLILGEIEFSTCGYDEDTDPNKINNIHIYNQKNELVCSYDINIENKVQSGQIFIDHQFDLLYTYFIALKEMNATV
jgi:hypothetical protein